MRKCLSIAGILLFAALLYVQPSKADSFDTFTLTANFVTITFTVPSTVTPATVSQAGMISLKNVAGTYGTSAYTFASVELGPTGYMGATNYAATGSMTRSVQLLAPGLFTWNADGTVTFNTGTFDLGVYKLTVVDPPGPGGDTVTTPEPASLLLLGFGGLALGALRRRKAS